MSLIAFTSPQPEIRVGTLRGSSTNGVDSLSGVARAEADARVSPAVTRVRGLAAAICAAPTPNQHARRAAVEAATINWSSDDADSIGGEGAALALVAAVAALESHHQLAAVYVPLFPAALTLLTSSRPHVYLAPALAVLESALSLCVPAHTAVARRGGWINVLWHELLDRTVPLAAAPAVDAGSGWAQAVAQCAYPALARVLVLAAATRDTSPDPLTSWSPGHFADMGAAVDRVLSALEACARAPSASAAARASATRLLVHLLRADTSRVTPVSVTRRAVTQLCLPVQWLGAVKEPGPAMVEAARCALVDGLLGLYLIHGDQDDSSTAIHPRVRPVLPRVLAALVMGEQGAERCGLGNAWQRAWKRVEAGYDGDSDRWRADVALVRAVSAGNSSPSVPSQMTLQ
ncbi:hypothetical protein BC828DRAFT_414772 [Blastocladiella britannica]|nr:hypothetical protein BC828DRAFT_414772 [Blastocladiella britannica]